MTKEQEFMKKLLKMLILISISSTFLSFTLKSGVEKYEKYSTYQLYILDKLLETSNEFGKAQYKTDTQLVKASFQKKGKGTRRWYTKFFPKEITTLILEYCEDMFVSGFFYRNLLFTLLLPTDDKDHSVYQKTSHPIISKHEFRPNYIRIPRNVLKKYILQETGFESDEAGTRLIELNNVYCSLSDVTENRICSIGTLSYDQLVGKNLNFEDVLGVLDEGEGPQNKFTTIKDTIYVNKFMQKNSTQRLENLLDRRQLVKYRFTCSNCMLPIPADQQLNELACVDIDPDRFKNGCKKLARTILVDPISPITLAPVTAPTSKKRKYPCEFPITSLKRAFIILGTCGFIQTVLSFTSNYETSTIT